MSDQTSPPASPDRPRADDFVLPFSIEGLEVRGRVVRLGPLVDTILARHNYPAPVSRLLGEAVALALLLGASLKFEGRFILQIQSDGPISMMVVDYATPDKVRACAKFDADAIAANQSLWSAPVRLLGKGHLAMTVDQGAQASRYQGVVPLEGGSLAEVADVYFRQSEQIPTFIKLAVAESFSAESGERGLHWRAGGLLIQHLPAEGGVQHRDLPPGDAPAEAAVQQDEEADQWTEARLIAETIEDDELTDPTISAERLLYRLFHERGVRVFSAQGVHEECRCTRERISGILNQFSAEDVQDMTTDDGAIVVTCEFCSAEYRFDPEQFG